MQALGGLVLVVVVMGMTAIGMASGASAQARNHSANGQVQHGQDVERRQDVLPECVIATADEGPVSVSTPITQVECDALAALYIATVGSAWTNSSGWATATDPCTWHGVTCGGTAAGLFGVIEVDLSWNQLSGSLPTQLGNLAHLQTLVLQGNDLAGPIPASIGGLTGLEFLALSDNPLDTGIPDELYGATALQLLVIEDAGLTGELSPSIANLTNLSVLVLNNNELAGSIPTEITIMDGLAVLGLADNNLSGVVPVGLDSMDGLIQLQLEGNNFIAADDDARAAAMNDAEVEVSVSCLAQNGRIDVALTNGAAAPVDYEVTVGHLASRARQVAMGGSEVVSVTGRADGPIQVSVTQTGVEIYTETMVVDCDPDLPTDSEVVVVHSCLQRNGRIDVVLNNLAIGGMDNSSADYEVTVGHLAPRVSTIDAGSSDRVTVTGRAEGPIDVTVRRGGEVVHAETVVIECDNVDSSV